MTLLRTPPSFRSLSLIAAAALAGACGGDAAEEAPPVEMASPAAPAYSVRIMDPANGSVVEGSNVTVRLQVEGVEIRPAGEVQEGTGHHHLLLDTDVNPAGTPVPTVPGSVVHLGDGSAQYVFENVSAGPHRLIAVVADGIHVPLQPWVVDTVTFTVR